MTRIEFSQLPPDEKTNYLWDYGICFGQRMVGKHYILSIFQLEDFFVEARYLRDNSGVSSIRVIREFPEWEAYIGRTIRRLYHLS